MNQIKKEWGRGGRIDGATELEQNKKAHEPKLVGFLEISW